MSYRGAVLFDLDGTLVDTAADFIDVINRMRAEDRLPPADHLLIRNTVSEGARGLVRRIFKLDDSDPQFEPQRQRLLDLYAGQLGNEARLFAGFEQLLPALEAQDIAWGIVTNKPWRFTEPLLQRLALSPSQAVAICPEHVTATKPAAEPLLLAASRLGLAPGQCLYAGDHRRDIEAARNAGMPGIACGFGYIHEDDDIHDWQADTIVQSVDELAAVIHHHFGLNPHV